MRSAPREPGGIAGRCGDCQGPLRQPTSPSLRSDGESLPVRNECSFTYSLKYCTMYTHPHVVSAGHNLSRITKITPLLPVGDIFREYCRRKSGLFKYLFRVTPPEDPSAVSPAATDTNYIHLKCSSGWLFFLFYSLRRGAAHQLWASLPQHMVVPRGCAARGECRYKAEKRRTFVGGTPGGEL